MKIYQLEYFLQIKRYTNFTVAAEECFVSHSCLSKQIAALEEEVGVKLIERNTRNVRLTKAGETFSYYASNILREYYKMNAAMQEYDTKKTVTINVYSIPILTQYGLIDRIIKFRKMYPRISVDVVEQSTTGIIKGIRNNEADIYILRPQSIPNCDLNICPLFEDEMVMVVSENHRFANREVIDLTEASNENFLLIGAGTDTFKTYVDECKKAGFMPRTQTANLSIDTIIKLVGEEEGITLLTHTVAKYLGGAKTKIVRLIQKPTLNTVALIRKDSNAVIKSFIEFVLNYT